MNVWLKRVLFSLVVALLLAVVGLAIFLLTFNPNAYKSRLESFVFERTARTLTIGGDIGLSLFPRIGLSVSDVSLSERDAPDTFVSVDSARFAVAIWPLLSNRLVVDHVAVTGLKAYVVRDAQGRFNFSDLLDARTASAAASMPAPMAAAAAVSGAGSDFNIDIAGLELKSGRVQYVDQRDGLSTVFDQIEANTGRVTYDQPFDVSLKAAITGNDPVQNAQLQAQALLRLNPAVRGYSAQKINVQLSGRLGNLDQSQATLRGNLAYDGEARHFSADNLELALNGNIVGAHPIQGLKASLTAAQLRLDQRNTALKIDKLALRAVGQDRKRALDLALDAPALAISPDSAQADPVTGTLKWTGDDTLAVSLGLEGLSGNANEWQFRAASLDGALTQGERLLHLKLTSPLAWNMSLRKGALNAIKGDMGVRDRALPSGSYEFPMIGSVHLDLVQDLLSADLSAVIDGGQAVFKSQTTGLTAPQPQTRFTLNTEKLDLNRWLPVPPSAGAAAKPAGGGKEAPKDKAADKAPEQAAAAPPPAPAPTPVDLSFLRGLDIEGDVKIGDLRVRNVQLTGVGLQARVQKGALAVSRLAAGLYEGTLTGQFNAAADQTFGLKLNLDKIAVAPLIQAAAGMSLLSGRGAAQIDLRAQGATVDELQRSLAGRAALQVRDGAVQGVDAARTLAEVAAALGNVLKGRLDAVASPFDSRRSTAFSSLDARLDLKDGQGTLSKLSLVSDLVKLSEGKPARIDVPGRTLDLVLQAQVAARLPKGLDAALTPLLGSTIPIRIRGAWDRPEYDVDWSNIRNPSIQRALKSGLMDLLQGRDLIDQALPAPEPEAAGAAPRNSAAPAAGADPVERIGKALKGLLGQ
ncbi:AsmA family protein [Castellaniella defragrans]|uniref:AsmA protein n=1 Tax=Castellaniella defragrans TaxID=75697 RepID=A0A7W9WMQ1_CASDE|nr:AsmA family protein [Castellaniella defragrans]KAB0620183.1 AsmA family protein [Castellaniella defragrans]MBB6084562.1 AsmA protein [Castellaniella defragrans]